MSALEDPTLPLEQNVTRSPLLNTDILVQLDGDLLEDGTFGLRTLEITSDIVRVRERNGATSFQMPIVEIKSARNEPLVGGGRLEVTTKKGEILPLLSYSLHEAARFSEAARGLEQLAKDEPLSINLKQEVTRCPKCSRLLPEKDGICPVCVDRGRTLLRIGRFMKPYRKQAFALAGLSLVTTGINLIPPQLQRLAIDNVLTKDAQGKFTGSLPYLLQMVGIWVAVVGVATVIQVLNGRLISFLAGNIASDLRSSVYRAIEFLQLTYFDKKQVGAITSRVTQDTDRVWGFLVDGVPLLVTNILLVSGISLFMFWINWKLAFAVLSPLPVSIVISTIFWKPVSQMYFRMGQKWAKFHMHLNESLTGIRVMKAFAKEDHEFAKFRIRNDELREVGISADIRAMTVSSAMTFFTGLGPLIHWSYGGYLVYTGEISFGTFYMVNAYLGLVYGPLQWFGQVNQWFSKAMAGAERIFEVIDSDTENYNTEAAPCTLKGEVVFENVRFGYDKSNPIIKNMTFTAKPGEMIGLVGKSGAGKSTTINLLTRFYEPDAGTIKLDGKDCREMDLQEMRRQVGIVLQEPFLFNGTVAENISYGKQDASLDEIMDAAKAANAHGFILGKPDGYDTIVGEKGGKLSGGERQRVSIARAILHNPKILILDEATSSVDVETEKQIQEAIQRLTAGRTTFAIAHRLSTLRNASRLIVLDKGEIVEIGTHAELMEKKGVFYSLVETQSKVTEILNLDGEEE